jgi:hypothetical protein
MADGYSQEPDYEVVQEIVKDVVGSWHDDLPGVPESSLDAMCVLCWVLRGGRDQIDFAAVNDIVRIEESRIDGVVQPGDWWTHISKCKPNEVVDADGYLCGIRCLLLVYGGLSEAPRGPDERAFFCEVVYKDVGCEYPMDLGVVEDRVRSWCSAVGKLGTVLEAERVEVPGRDDTTPMVLWRGPY